MPASLEGDSRKRPSISPLRGTERLSIIVRKYRRSHPHHARCAATNADRRRRRAASGRRQLPAIGRKKKLIVIGGRRGRVLLLVGGGRRGDVCSAEARGRRQRRAEGDEEGAGAESQHDAKNAHRSGPPTFAAARPLHREPRRPRSRALRAGRHHARARQTRRPPSRSSAYMPAIRNDILMVLAHKTSRRAARARRQGAAGREILREAARRWASRSPRAQCGGAARRRRRAKQRREARAAEPTPVRARALLELHHPVTSGSP